VAKQPISPFLPGKTAFCRRDPSVAWYTNWIVYASDVETGCARLANHQNEDRLSAQDLGKEWSSGSLIESIKMERGQSSRVERPNALFASDVAKCHACNDWFILSLI